MNGGLKSDRIHFRELEGVWIERAGTVGGGTNRILRKSIGVYDV